MSHQLKLKMKQQILTEVPFSAPNKHLTELVCTVTNCASFGPAVFTESNYLHGR